MHWWSESNVDRMEKVRIKTSPGMMKVGGVALCMGGVAVIAFYRGPFLKLLLHHHLLHNHLQHSQQHDLPSPNTWIKGVFLMLLANLCWAFWLVLQVRTYDVYLSISSFNTFIRIDVYKIQQQLYIWWSRITYLFIYFVVPIMVTG